MSITPSPPLFFGPTATIVVPVGYTGNVLTCLGTAEYDNPARIEWLKGAVVLSWSVSNTEQLLRSVLKFENGYTRADAGQYACMFHTDNSSSSRTRVVRLGYTTNRVAEAQVRCQIDSSTAYFQIRVLNLPCGAWDREVVTLAEASLEDVLRSEITSSCDACTLENTTIVITNLTSCSALLDKAIVFKGSIISTDLALTKATFCELDKWQDTGPEILLGSSSSDMYFVDRKCSFKLESLEEPECLAGESDSQSLLLFSSGVGLFLFVVLLSAGAGAIGALIKRR